MGLFLSAALQLISLFLILSISAHFPLAAASTTSRGLSGDECTTTANCKGSRICYYLPLDSPSSFGPCDMRDSCYCGTQDITDLICSSAADCSVPGEVCATFAGLRISGCLSLAAVEKHPELSLAEPSLAEDDFVPDILPLPEDQLPDMQTPGDDFDPTISPQPEAQPLETEGADDDFDLDISPPPEEPVEIPQFSESEGIQGVAGIEEFEPSASPKSESSCIAVQHLQHVPSEQLLFSTHVRARVLCDRHQNCATPGHVVQFDGRPMMMKSYCTLVTCKPSVRLVNSPKYERRARIPSRSSRLVFTALAARFESDIEEKLLSIAVRIGL
ncbi:hypothetical protein BWQ96_08352 [Gracilariopsis chorda]|uniref:Uncharacterized protein n=1 Tax=Gracilariopsis chorda TaxID=448386 RepID=A0A2V3IL88_9FLOR|nr:hypothetical protein BWQ96_08352 [Gracilariopsis chorda]|eukprot:PXF41900.1 hypothetical protein BWQ96_08352 [Gracilariopsis chorda]